MTTMLEKAFKEASKLSDLEQNNLAKIILEEMKSEKKWENLFAESEDILASLASEALEEEKLGKTTELDIEKL